MESRHATYAHPHHARFRRRVGHGCASGDRSAYEALQQLRPSFLHSRDTQTSRNPIPPAVDVFVDGGRTEGLDELKNIRASTVKEMRFYEPQDANTKFGTGHNGGVIAVILK